MRLSFPRAFRPVGFKRLQVVTYYERFHAIDKSEVHVKVADATPTPCIDFSKIQSVIKAPDLLKVQLDSFHNFIQDSVPLAKTARPGS